MPKCPINGSLGLIEAKSSKSFFVTSRIGLFNQMQSMSCGWQLALQSIKSLKHELNLKKIIIIAGPNGAGKTTFARDFLPAEAQTLRFINADLIAAGLAPFNPETASFKAGRLMLEEIDECVDAGHSFAFETTLSGLAYLKKIAVWQHLGYQVKLWFLSLPNQDIAVSRVARRVLQGGHNIPEDVIRRRFKAGLANFHERYSKVVDSWAFYDSSGMHPKLIDWSKK
jgi:predicted ABC-type ATPase